MRNDEITEQIIGCCFKVHRKLGPGFPEKIYQKALEKALEKADVAFASEQSFRVLFEKSTVGSFRVDLLAEGRVVIEVKAVSGLLPKIFETQVLSYLKAARLSVGLLVNFGNRSCQVRRLEVS